MSRWQQRFDFSVPKVLEDDVEVVNMTPHKLVQQRVDVGPQILGVRVKMASLTSFERVQQRVDLTMPQRL